MNRMILCLMAIATSLGSVACVYGEDASLDYVRDIKPLLKARCYACHGALKQEADLRLDTGALVRQGGASGSLVVRSTKEESLLLQRVSTPDDLLRMPPEGGRLTEVEIDLLQRWIAQGAISPSDELPEDDANHHWAFQLPKRPIIPVPVSEIEANQVVVNPIDAFLLQRRHEAGVPAMRPADRATLLRRLYIDLIGLPPSAAELEAFLADNSEQAYVAVVERLLESPQHGERWARHWMDVWRYSDWYGRRSVPDVMNSYPMIWRWRDWIVQSLNQDKPYDQMIIEMLAADELMPEDEQRLVATGFLVRSWFKWNYETWKKDLVEHTGKAFLGLTMNCAQCHDHKYDPLTQEEYFKFRAFFEPLELRHDRIAGEPDPGPFVKYVYAVSYGPIKSGMIRVFDEYLNAETFMFSKGDSRLKIEGKPPVSPGAPAFLGGDRLQPSQIQLPITAAYPGMKESVKAEERSKWKLAINNAEKQLKDAQSELARQPTEMREELKSAALAYAEARQAASQLLSVQTEQNLNRVKSRVLEGTQSLILDAKTGRRTLSHPLANLDLLDNNGTVSYLLQLTQDGNSNLQLALDITQGATGGYVAFEKGAIKTYAPGGFNEFTAGNYDTSIGQDRFRVQLQLDVAQNQFLLSVLSLNDNQRLVDAVPAGLNGWKPQADGKRGLFLDCREGTATIFDDLRFTQPDGSDVLRFDFEPPAFQEGHDVTEATSKSDLTSWIATSYCKAPATSLVISTLSENLVVQAALARLTAARQALNIPLVALAAAEANLAAAKLEQVSLEKRIEVDSVRYSSGLLAEDRQEEPDIKALIHSACQHERQANLATAQAHVASSESDIALIEARLTAAREKKDQAVKDQATKDLQAAKKRLAAANEKLDAARAAIAKELGDYTPLSPKYPQVTTGRRAALAHWIANTDNPLTARVAVNHVWLRHFGQALVDTTHDFGRNGSPPSHPQLLDWLACELMDSGWSLKHLHRLIVTSRAYRMASILPQSVMQQDDVNAKEYHQAMSVDPDNKLYWRFPATRMQAEVVRDSLLALSGELDQTLGGHEIDHRQGLSSRRRSLYFTHHGEEKMEFLELFDAANACDCYRRSSSVQPQQALALINSELTKSLSRQLEDRLWNRSNVDPDGLTVADVSSRFVRMAFLQVLNREPGEQELLASQKFLEHQALRLSSVDSAPTDFSASERARENLLHALMNHNDFVTVR